MYWLPWNRRSGRLGVVLGVSKNRQCAQRNKTESVGCYFPICLLLGGGTEVHAAREICLARTSGRDACKAACHQPFSMLKGDEDTTTMTRECSFVSCAGGPCMMPILDSGYVSSCGLQSAEPHMYLRGLLYRDY